MATIDLRRPRRLYGALFAFTVSLDGKEVGRLRPGGATTVEVGEGQHNLAVSQGRHPLAKRLLTVDSPDNGQRFVVLATNSPVKLLRSLLPSSGAGMVTIDPEAP